MSESILTSTKQILGLEDSYEAFDLDIMTHINAAFAVLHQLGVGPDDGLFIENKSTLWSALGLSGHQLGLVKSWTYLKVRAMFDPPSASYHTNLMKEQIAELEGRIHLNREFEYVPPEVPEEP